MGSTDGSTPSANSLKSEPLTALLSNSGLSGSMEPYSGSPLPLALSNSPETCELKALPIEGADLIPALPPMEPGQPMPIPAGLNTNPESMALRLAELEQVVAGLVQERNAKREAWKRHIDTINAILAAERATPWWRRLVGGISI
jgi:hypothetical protein